MLKLTTNSAASVKPLFLLSSWFIKKVPGVSHLKYTVWHWQASLWFLSLSPFLSLLFFLSLSQTNTHTHALLCLPNEAFRIWSFQNQNSMKNLSPTRGSFTRYFHKRRPWISLKSFIFLSLSWCEIWFRFLFPSCDMNTACILFKPLKRITQLFLHKRRDASFIIKPCCLLFSWISERD